MLKNKCLVAVGLALTGLLGLGTGDALASEPKLINIFTDWEAYTYESSENGGVICYIGSIPKTSKGNYKRRGNIYMTVTHRPDMKHNNEVSFVAGYTYKPESEVEVTIGSRKFKLFTHEDSAWARDSKTDEQLVRMMRKGSNMVVRGTSSRGTLTTDSYSLSGFTAAYNAASKSCGVKALR